MSHFIVINRNKHNKIVAVHADIGNACEEQMVLSERFPTDTFEVIDTQQAWMFQKHGAILEQ